MFKRAWLGVVGLVVIWGCEGQLGSGFSTSGPGSTSGNNSTLSGGGGGPNLSAGAGANSSCPECTENESGVGTNNPFDPESKDSDNVGTDDEGALVLDPSKSNIPGIIWIANTSFNTVTKVDTTTFAILGRYSVGSSDPSRTSVNGLGDVFVGNRAGNTLMKISAAGSDCPDTNNDGQVKTSTGFNDVLPYGTDDCVIWESPVPNNPKIRGVAAQDVIVSTPEPDNPDKKEVKRYVWVGGTNHRTLYKFDADDGKLLIQTEGPTGNYGLALSADGNLWVSGRTDGNNNILGRVDTAKCFDQASCDAAQICSSTCNANGSCTCDPGCSTPCDQATKERIKMPASIYGVTVDFKQRVWMGGDQVMRYDPNAAAGSRYAGVGGTGFVHGIAADAKGSIWGAGQTKVVRIDATTLDKVDIGVSAKGIAIDKNGKVWGVEYGPNAHVITPGSNTLTDYTTTNAAVTGLGKCYTYSDMTGLQLALATNKPGWYREVVEGCPAGGATSWHQLTWDVELPPGTSAVFRARTADMQAALANAKWVQLAKLPLSKPPVDIPPLFLGQNIVPGKLLELEVELVGTISGDTLVSPKVKSFGVTHSCPPVAN